MASSRKSRLTSQQVLSIFYDDTISSSNESSDGESDFMDYVGIVDVSDSNSDEESTLTVKPVIAGQSGRSSQVYNASVRQDNPSADLLDDHTTLSSPIPDDPHDVESSNLESCAFDVWQSSEADSDILDDDDTAELEDTRNIQEESGLYDIIMDSDGAEDKDGNESDGADDRDSNESDGADDRDSNESDGADDRDSNENDDADDRDRNESGADRSSSNESEQDVEQDFILKVRGRGRGRTRVRGRGRGHAPVRGRGRGHAPVRGRGRGRGQARGLGRRGGQNEELLPASATPISVNDSSFEEGEAFCPTREVGPQLSDDDSSAELDLFSKYFDDTVIKQLVDATNDYAEQKKNTKRLMYKRFKNVPLTSDEMSRYLGVLLLLSISSIRSYRQAWNPRSSQVRL